MHCRPIYMQNFNVQIKQLERSSAVKQTLTDVYGAECVRLQSEVKRLSRADVTTDSEDSQHHHHQQQQQQQPLAGADVQKISQVL